MSLALTAIRGTYFTGAALAFRQLISFLTIFYIARILSPADFGVAAMVTVVIGLAQVVGDVGFSSGLVRTQQNSSTALSTCFWIGLGIGVAMTLIVIALAPVAEWFYGVDAVGPLLRVAALGLLVNFCTPVPMAILQQRLGYKEIALAQALGSFAGALIAIASATAGLGVWSLIIQPIAGNLVALALMAMYAKWWPSRQFDYSSVREILHDGFNLLGAGIAQYARGNFDTVVIGNALESKDLGVYSMARTVLYAPTYLITSVVSRVIFPLLAKIQDDPEKVKLTILTAMSRTGLAVFPLYLGLLVVADDFVLLAFGKNWQEMVPLIYIMTLAAMIQSISYIGSPILIALGASRLSFRISLGGSVFYFLALLAAIRYGLTAVAFSYMLVNSIVGIVTVALTLRVARIRAIEFLPAVGRPLLMALVMMAAILLIRAQFSSGSPLRMAVLIGSGILIYGVMTFFIEKKALRQLRDALKNKKL